MKIIGLDGKSYQWNLSGHLEGSPNCSSYHKRARALLETLFPVDIRLEEVTIPGGNLRADFFLPNRRLLVEVQGEQHFKMNGLHHGHDVLNFWASVKRDRHKEEFCEVNRILYVALPHWESDEQWKDRLLGKRNPAGPDGDIPR